MSYTLGKTVAPWQGGPGNNIESFGTKIQVECAGLRGQAACTWAWSEQRHHHQKHLVEFCCRGSGKQYVHEL